MAVETFAAGDGDFTGAGSKDGVDGGCFGGVVGLRGGGVGVDVGDAGLDVFWRGLQRDCGFGDSGADSLRWAFGARLRDVVGVGGHSEAENLREDGGVLGAGGREGFEGEDGGAFGEGHAVAVGRERAAGGGGDDAHGVPGAEEGVGERGFVGSRERGVNDSGSDHLEGEADGVGTGGAGCGDGEGWAGDVLIDCDLGRAVRGHRARDGEWVDAGVLGVDAGDFRLFSRAAIGRAAEEDGDAVGGVVLGELGLRGGLTSGEYSQVGTALGCLELGGGEGLSIQIWNLPRVTEFQSGVFSRQWSDAGLAGFKRVPEAFWRRADGGEAAESGDDDAIECRHQ